MGISWREILTLLIGLGLCYGIVSYALASAQERASAPEEDPRLDSTTEQTTESTTTPSPDGEEKTVTVRVTGSSGQSFGANVGNLRSSRSVEGTVPESYEVEVLTDPNSGDHVSAMAWKTAADTKELKVQIVDNGTVVREGSTTKDYGATSARWNPNESPPPPETTTPAGGTTTPTDAEKATKSAAPKDALPKDAVPPKDAFPKDAVPKEAFPPKY